MRIYLLYSVIVILLGIGFVDWFLPMCGLIVLCAFMERHDMPSNIMGIAGANPWNLLLIIVLCHWWIGRCSEGLRWDLRGWPLLVLTGYIMMLVVGFARAALDIDAFPVGSMTTGSARHADYTIMGLLIDEVGNPLRYLIPGLILYDGCRSRSRTRMAIMAIVLMGLCYAVFVVKYIPLGVILSLIHISEPTRPY